MGSVRVAHNPQGLSQLDAYLEQIAGAGGQEQLACIVETTHGLLIAHLLEQGWAVYPVNPRTVERRRAPSGARRKAQKRGSHLQQPSLQANAVTTRTRSRLMLALAAQLQALLTQITDYDEEIERLFLSHADSELFQTLPGAEARLAPRLLAEMGDDRSRYESASSLQTLAGTSPVLYQSGTYQKAHRRLGCIKPWRNAMSRFAWQSTHQQDWAREYYRRKRAEGKSHTVAARVLAHVWARMLYTVWKTRELYQPTTFEQARRAHAKRCA